MKDILGELDRMKNSVPIFCGIQSVVHLATNPVYHSKTKHIDIKYHFVRKVIDAGGLDLKKAHIQENCAHMFAKPVLLETTVVLGFSWLAKEVINSIGKSI